MYNPGIPVLDTYPKGFKATTQRDICTTTFTAALFIITPKSPSTDELAKCNAMEYSLVLKRKKILTRSTTWMNLEDKLNKTSQAQMNKYCTIALIRDT